uniref:Uncharacterized protein n=1 Tax=Avena sativa TaxID=4498 RepID=A0ACD5YJJ1_AVESA
MAQFHQYGILSPVLSLVANEIWKPIKKHFGYCLKAESKVRNLGKAADDLKITTDTIDEKIQLGEREGKRPRMQATGWIESARSVVDESHRIKNEYEGRSIHIFGCSWNCFFNYKTGRAATKKKSDADEMKERAPQNDSIFRLLPSAGRELPLPPNIVGQNEYKDKIVGYIKQGTTSFIGICGMGGSGKTTLLKQLNNIFSYAAETHEFDHVIYVEVGQKQNLNTVQQNIASQLGLALGQDESTTSRSASLYNFLKKRKFLLLIDDLCQTLDLVKAGIPQGYVQNRQIIIVTTRLQHVCYRMQAHVQVIMLQRLKFDEAWSLFAANAGHRQTNSSAQIRGYAESIVEKCGGLPLALKIVGQAIASKESEHEWKHAMMLLQQSQFHKLPDAESDLYSILYVSYDHLPDERTKQCFLLFVLTSYDRMQVTHIIDFWMGHGLLDEDNDIRKRYLRGHSIVGCLKRACLLEEHPQEERYVRMHDIVRDLALWIVATQQGDGCNKKQWLSRHHGEPLEEEEWGTAERIFLWGKSDVTIPDSCSCPLLLTLVLQFNTRFCKVPRGFFRTAPSLTFLDLSRTNIQQLPSDVGALVNLQLLNLSETPIQSIQMELQLLKSLRYLYLAFTYHLKAIPDGTISALSMLKVVDLYDSGRFPKDKARSYIEELESLTWLQFLGFTVGDHDSLHRIFDLSKASLTLRRVYIKGLENLQHLHISPVLIWQIEGTTTRDVGTAWNRKFGGVADR